MVWKGEYMLEARTVSLPWLDQKISIEELLPPETEKVEEVPVGELLGIQPPSAYTDGPMRRIDRMYSQKGSEFLEEHPIRTCTIKGPDNSPVKVILDGHNRVRRAPRYGITRTPIVNYEPEDLARFMSNRGHDISPEVIEDSLFRNAVVAKEAFSQRMGGKYTPCQLYDK